MTYSRHADLTVKNDWSTGVNFAGISIHLHWLFSTASIRESAIDILKLIVIIISEIMFTIISSLKQVMWHP